MVRRKEFSLRFTDSLLLAGTETFVNSKIADDIFNDPEAWSDASLESGDDEEKATVPYSAVASSKPQGEFIIKPFARKNSRRRRASFSSASSPEFSPPTNISVDIKRLSIIFPSPISWSGDSPLTVSPASSKNSLLTPLVTSARSPATAGVGSPIVVSASATWSFLEWLGTGSQPDTPKHPPHTAGAPPKVPNLPASAVPKSALLMVPSLTTPKRRPLPTVPTPSSAQSTPMQFSPMQPSPLQITSPPPPPPRGARVRRSPAPPPRIIESPPPLPPVPTEEQSKRPKRNLPPLVPKSKAPIAWKAS